MLDFYFESAGRLWLNSCCLVTVGVSLGLSDCSVMGLYRSFPEMDPRVGPMSYVCHLYPSFMSRVIPVC